MKSGVSVTDKFITVICWTKKLNNVGTDSLDSPLKTVDILLTDMKFVFGFK